MAKFLLIVPSSAKPDRDADYNEWYDTIHIHDILGLPGVTSGRRYDAVPAFSANTPPANYMAIYEIEAENPGETMAALGKIAQSGEMKMTDSLDPGSAQMWIYQER